MDMLLTKYNWSSKDVMVIRKISETKGILKRFERRYHYNLALSTITDVCIYENLKELSFPKKLE